MLASPRALRSGLRASAAALTALLTATLLVPAPPAAAAGLDTTDRATVAKAYRDVYLPAVAVTAPAPATTAASTCRSGSSAALQQATLTAVNYVRDLSGVPPVTLYPAYSDDAQQAALMMYANNAISYDPPSTWACYTADGAEGAVNSNLSATANGAGVVEQYMDDAGTSHTAVGRRSALQLPNLQRIGTGTVGSFNALWVGAAQGFPDLRYTSWPSAGYFPAPLEPQGRWSFTPWNTDDDVSHAKVTVTGPDGSVPVTLRPVSGRSGALVFELGSLPQPTGSRVDRYTVTVSGIVNWGEVIDDFSYDVKLIDPMSGAPTPLEATTPPAVSGELRVGQTLTASAPSWSTADVTTTYQWFRGASPITGATGSHYVLTADDLGQQLSVRATGTKSGVTAATVSSSETAAVADLPQATLAVDASSAAVGELALAVAVQSGSQPATGGELTVTEGGRTLQSGIAVEAGKAAYATTGVTPGQHTYTVRYSGTVSLRASSTTVTTTVKAKAKPVVAATAKSPAKRKLVLSLAVTAPGQSALTGKITVLEGKKTLTSSVALSKGKASWTTTKLGSGKHTLTFRYAGTSQVATGSLTKKVTVR